MWLFCQSIHPLPFCTLMPAHTVTFLPHFPHTPARKVTHIIDSLPRPSSPEYANEEKGEGLLHTQKSNVSCPLNGPGIISDLADSDSSPPVPFKLHCVSGLSQETGVGCPLNVLAGISNLK